MDPKIVMVELPPLRLVGVSCVFIGSMNENSDAHEKIPEAWHTFGHLASDNGVSMDWTLGVMTGSDEPGKMTYVACAPVDASALVPRGMTEVDLLGAAYVGCEHVGSLNSIGQTTA